MDKGRASLGWTWIYAPRSRAICISSKWNQERLLTQHGKEHPGKQGNQELTEQALQLSKLNSMPGSTGPLWVNDSQPHFPHL